MRCRMKMSPFFDLQWINGSRQSPSKAVDITKRETTRHMLSNEITCHFLWSCQNNRVKVLLVSGSSFWFADNTEDRETCWTAPWVRNQQNPDEWDIPQIKPPRILNRQIISQGQRCRRSKWIERKFKTSKC